MLLGDHAVVYQRPCLVTAVDQRMFLTVDVIEESVFQLHAPDVGITEYQKPLSEIGKGEIPKGASYIEAAVSLYIQKFCRPSGIRITTESKFSSRVGFGSSSASVVCVLHALFSLYKQKVTKKELFTLCYQVIQTVAGVGSGFDLAAQIYGGVLYFVTGGREIQPLPVANLPLLIGYTGVKADTPTIVKDVARKKNQFPKLYDALFSVSDLIVSRGKNALIDGDLALFGQMMDSNEGLLASLGVESEILCTLIHNARAAGAYGAKLSGAGMGDCMIALAPPERVGSVKDAIASHGQFIDVACNAEAVKVESV